MSQTTFRTVDSRDRSVDTSKGYVRDEHSSIPGRVRLFSSQHPDRLCGPPSLLAFFPME